MSTECQLNKEDCTLRASRATTVPRDPYLTVILNAEVSELGEKRSEASLIRPYSPSSLEVIVAKRSVASLFRP